MRVGVGVRVRVRAKVGVGSRRKSLPGYSHTNLSPTNLSLTWGRDGHAHQVGVVVHRLG